MVSSSNFISYDLDNDKLFRAALDRARLAIVDFTVPFTQIATDFYKSQWAIFNLQGPGQYPPFKNSKVAKYGRHTETHVYSPYQQRKILKYGFDYPLLVASGRLRDSVTSPDAPGSIFNLTYNSLEIGTSVPYGVYHQSDSPRKKIPLRKFLFIGPEAPQFAVGRTAGRPQRWMNILNDYVLKKLKQKGPFS